MTAQPDELPRSVNGIDRERLETVVDAFRDMGHAHAQDRPWRARVVWEGGFRSKVLARQHRMDFDEPGMGTEDVAPTPVEGLLAALGACLTAAFAFHATRRGITIYNLEMTLEGRFGGMRTIAELGPDPVLEQRGIAAKAYVRADASEEVVRQLWNQAIDASLVNLAVGRPTTIDLELDVV